MASSPSQSQSSLQIDSVEMTTDTLTSRGGMTLFVRYLRNISLMNHLDRHFGRLRKSAKGAPIAEMFKQIICFCVDGTSRHLTYFDHLMEDEGYARGIETDPGEMVSSHSVKRFFKSFSWPLIWFFRQVLQQLFLWRLNHLKPDVIVLGIDSMVMDNDEAVKRHGVQPTYKKVKGFHPLQMTWGRFIVDAVFRGGKKHCNHGETVAKMVCHIVANIRSNYRADVPIVILLDSGFFDQKLFRVFEKLGIGYVCGGKLNKGVKAYVKSVEAACWGRLNKSDQTWDYLEFGDKGPTWSKYRRAVFCRPRYEGRQSLLKFARPETILYTNLGRGERIDGQLDLAGRERWLTAEGVIKLAHRRGREELVHRALKDFRSQELPFKRFSPNAAFYYVILLAFFLCEAFKEDVLSKVVPVEAYPTTLRRKVIDIAAKIVRTGGKTILKVTAVVWNRLDIQTLWGRSSHPPAFSWA